MSPPHTHLPSLWWGIQECRSKLKAVCKTFSQMYLQIRYLFIQNVLTFLPLENKRYRDNYELSHEVIQIGTNDLFLCGNERIKYPNVIMGLQQCLLYATSAVNKICSYFFQKIGFNISCKSAVRCATNSAMEPGNTCIYHLHVPVFIMYLI